MKRAAVCRIILFNRKAVLSDGAFALFMLCTVLWWLAPMPAARRQCLGFDFMEFPDNCGSLLLPIKETAACTFVSWKPVMNRLCPG